MESSEGTAKLSGNPVFDYKAGFRVKAAWGQKILFNSGLILIVAGLIGRFVPFGDESLTLTFCYAPVLGLGICVLSGIWAYAWRTKLRNDFCREYALKT